jgi:hypothetical protein
MPYITSQERELYYRHLVKLCEVLSARHEDDLGGHLNYCITYILNELFAEKGRYVRINTLIGAIEGAKQEFYRVHVIPYEEEKRSQNGDV